MRVQPISRLPWAHRAACRNHPEPDLWFPTTSQPSDSYRARQICLGCPVRVDCTAYVLTTDDITDGIWGGFTAPELRNLRRRATK